MKKIIVTLLAVLAFLGLTACGGPPSTYDGLSAREWAEKHQLIEADLKEVKAEVEKLKKTPTALPSASAMVFSGSPCFTFVIGPDAVKQVDACKRWTEALMLRVSADDAATYNSKKKATQMVWRLHPKEMAEFTIITAKASDDVEGTVWSDVKKYKEANPGFADAYKKAEEMPYSVSGGFKNQLRLIVSWHEGASTYLANKAK